MEQLAAFGRMLRSAMLTTRAHIGLLRVASADKGWVSSGVARAPLSSGRGAPIPVAGVADRQDTRH
ncbi:hypothetical protein OG762_41900 [Streptomyces sp. NBC_01136]|uniref:hypothetical protein n=1 Tax=unclassified Streptomyces TaxID=2593676 RepID=UPI00324AF171|nr:hypothetical protein OG762_41900 [Streptomyces sp. NBC_01136]